MKNAFIHITNACNLRCIHCAYSSGKKLSNELTLGEIEVIAKQVKKNGGNRIMIGGGEPLMHPDIKKILDVMASLELSVNLETNLTCNSKIITKLSEYKNLVITTSVDSMNPKEHNRKRGGKHSYQKTVQYITYLRSKNMTVRFNSLILKTNIDEINAFLDFSKVTGAIFRPLMRIIKNGRSEENGLTSVALEPSDILFVLETIFKFLETNDKNLVIFYLPPALIPPNFITLSYVCNWGNFLGVAADGSFGVCPAALNIKELMSGNVRDVIAGKQKFDDIDFLQFSQKFNPNMLKGVCSKCIARHKCRGGCRVDAYKTFGSLLAPDPICESFFNHGLFPKYALEPQYVDES